VAWILVVEDDEDVRWLIRRRLGTAHEVVSVSSAEDGLVAVNACGLPDVAILDIGLPGMSGLDLAAELRLLEGGAHCALIFLSANVLPEHVAAGRAIGGNYLTKPFAARVLLDAVDAALLVTS